MEKNMKKFLCELCGGTEFENKNNFQICKGCGLKYPIKEQLKNDSIVVNTQQEELKKYNEENDKLEKELLRIQEEIKNCEKQRDEVIKKNSVDKYWKQLVFLHNKNLLTEEKNVYFIKQIESIETQAKKVLELIDLKIKILNQKVSQIKSKL